MVIRSSFAIVAREENAGDEYLSGFCLIHTRARAIRCNAIDLEAFRYAGSFVQSYITQGKLFQVSGTDINGHGYHTVYNCYSSKSYCFVLMDILTFESVFLPGSRG